MCNRKSKLYQISKPVEMAKRINIVRIKKHNSNLIIYYIQCKVNEWILSSANSCKILFYMVLFLFQVGILKLMMAEVRARFVSRFKL